jgi:hypothetical protein
MDQVEERQVTAKEESVGERPDRVLGDGWSESEIQACRFEVDSETGKGWFLGIAALIVLSNEIALALFWYLIAPRLGMLSPGLPVVAGVVFIAVGVFLLVWFGLLALSCFTEKNFLQSSFLAKLIINMIPTAMKIGSRLGMSKDRLANSFIKVNNSLLRAGIISICRDRPIVLAPRCLTAGQKAQILELGKKYHCQVFTVGGGSAARKIIGKNKPSAIVAIACERDLLSGIKDVAPKLPVIGIPNRRPEGPCKNTEVDIKEFEEALKFSIEGR